MEGATQSTRFRSGSGNREAAASNLPTELTAARHSYPLGAAMVPPSFGNVNCETAWTTLASGLDETPEQPVADEYGNEPRTPTRSGRPMRPERRVGSGVSGLCLASTTRASHATQLVRGRRFPPSST